MGVVRRLAGMLLPVGSTRRARFAAIARSTGVWSGPADTDYQRWVRLIEPRLFSPVRAVPDLLVEANVSVGPSSSVTDLERTLLSLAAQTYPRWTVVMSGVGSAQVQPAAERLRLAEPRFLASSDGAPDLSLAIEAGDALSPAALNEVVLAFDAAPGVLVVVGDIDHLSASGDQRIDPVRVNVVDPDAARQFDLLSAFAAYRVGSSRMWASARLFAGDLAGVSAIPLVLLHRRHRVGPPIVQLAGADASGLRGSLGGRVDVDNGAPGFGTRVRWRPAGDVHVAVVIRHAVSSAIGVRQRHDLERSLGDPSFVRATLLDSSGDVPADIAAQACEIGADAVLVVDGSLRLGAADFLDDMVGVLLRSDVLAVAPIVTVPSGMVVDAGLTLDGSVLRPRCGGLLRPPFDLPLTRAVGAFSGRLFCIRTGDLTLLEDLSAASFAAAAAASGRRLVVWPHQRAVVEYDLAPRDAGSPSAGAWSRGRLVSWFGPGIDGYRPLNDSKAESVW